MLMNLQLHHVVADITGKTGLRIIRSIIEGERDPPVLAAMRDVRCKSSVKTIAAALEGNYRDEHLLSLRQSLSLYDTYQGLMHECDQSIECALTRLRRAGAPEKAPKSAKKRSRQPNDPRFDVRSAVYAVTGVDLTQIDGIGPGLALRIVGECGTDMSKWPTAKHFTSWLCLAPGT
jgi:transposase